MAVARDRPEQALWLRNARVWTGGARPRVFSGGVLVRGERQEALGHDEQLARQAAGARVLDAGGRLLVPGFINAHMHLYSALARGMNPPGKPATNFAEILERLWWRLDAALDLDAIAAGAGLLLLEGLRAGVTTVIDHHASYGSIAGSLGVLAGSAHRLGVRLSTGFEISDRHGPAAVRQALEENLRFAGTTRGREDLAALLGLHASFTLSDVTLGLCRQALDEYGLASHVHLAEDPADNEDARRRGFSGAAGRLLDTGVLPPGSLAVHGVHSDPADWQRLAAAGVDMVHNPQSNMNNAVGAAPLRQMLATGLRVGIGTDGMEADVREELRAAYLLGRHREGDPRLMWPEVSALLDNNRRIASRLFGVALGEIATGAAADLVVLDYHPPTPLEAGNFTGHLLFGCGRSPAWLVVSQGRVRIEAGQPVEVDPAQVAARAHEQAKRLWRRLSCSGS